jgi:hypothetical protein
VTANPEPSTEPAAPAAPVPASSVSPNPRPTITPGAWAADAIAFVAKEYNAMIHEIEALSAHVLHLGGDPKQAVAPSTPTATPDVAAEVASEKPAASA